MQPTDFVGPPAHGGFAPLQQNRRVMVFRFGQVRHFVGEGLCFHKVFEGEYPA